MTRKTMLISVGAVILAGLGVGLLFGIPQYKYRFSEVVARDITVKVHPETTIETLAGNLSRAGVVPDSARMVDFHARFTPQSIKPGNYALEKGISYRTLLTRLVNGRQTPVRLTFNNVRTLDQLAGRFARYTMADSLEHLRVLRSDTLQSRLGATRATLPALFLPDTYEIYWTATTSQIVDKLYEHQQKFWNSRDRLARAKSLGLTPLQVSIIASIVAEETHDKREMSDVAGVYINRLRRNMPLQADPTVKFAMGDFGLKRILNKHLETSSPYNTYKNAGLPPGPICIPPAFVIDKVLDYKGHSYLYFCAKEDFSGSHAFAGTLAQHTQNARRYQNALNRANIR